MKFYLLVIRLTQEILIKTGILTLCVLPLLIVFTPDFIYPYMSGIYSIAHTTAFFVMLIRPLSDIFGKLPKIISSPSYIRPLVILRKGFGIISASIVVSFIFSKIIIDPSGYFLGILDPAYWSLTKYALIAHIADITAILLLITSNNFSKRIMGTWWKRIQRLSYVYFFASAFYVFVSFDEMYLFYYMLIIASITLVASVLNSLTQKNSNPQIV